MTVAAGGRDDWHGCVVEHEVLQPFASARNDDVDVLVLREHYFARVAGGIVDKSDNVAVAAGTLHRAAHDLVQHAVGVQRVFPAAQYDSVAGFQAKRRRVHRDVGTRFVYDADDAERYADALEVQPVGEHPLLDDLAHGITQRGDLFQPLDHRCDTAVGEREPVDERRFPAVFLCGFHVLSICLRKTGEIIRVRQGVGYRAQHSVLFVRGTGGKRVRRLFCLPANLFYVDHQSSSSSIMVMTAL